MNNCLQWSLVLDDVLRDGWCDGAGIFCVCKFCLFCGGMVGPVDAVICEDVVD